MPTLRFRAGCFAAEPARGFPIQLWDFEGCRENGVPGLPWLTNRRQMPPTRTSLRLQAG